MQLNALANRAAGKGYENEDNYSNIRFQFVGIENIHVMRTSLQKLLEGGRDFTPAHTQKNLLHPKIAKEKNKNVFVPFPPSDRCSVPVHERLPGWLGE